MISTWRLLSRKKDRSPVKVNLDRPPLLDVLTHLERYSGILVTSPRSAIPVSKAVNKLELELKHQVFKKLQSMPVFSVGAATSR
ncbi:hypothetical protein PsorP6_004239 [Peronosclerospora sorghi]|uniref:Uncharacterized protein n=1 Tax=Peronosclerospora sorghi TaxID=230839 RepID=A0ACC0VRT4_9STRA|nr:hypothetical protein PsorP6_004239 [Peronosclerospora sorghi]